MVDSIIFDLDGTLWSCVDTCIEAWNQVLIDAVITKQQLQSVLGLQHDKLAEELLPFLQDSEKQEVLEKIYRIEVTLIREKGGELFSNTEFVLNTLCKLAGHPVYHQYKLDALNYSLQ